MQVTRQTLRESLIFRADLPAAEPRRYSDIQLNMLLSESVRRLQGNLITWWGDDYFTVRTETTVAALAETVSLPADTKLKTVIWPRQGAQTTGRTRSVKLARVDLAQIHGRSYAGPQQWSTSDPPRWWVEFQDPDYVLRFTYAPTVEESIHIYHVAEIAPFTDDADYITLEWGWEDWLVLDALVRMRQRDKQEYTDILDERLRLEDKIRQQAPEKGQTEVRAIRDVYPAAGAGPYDERRGWYW